MKENDKWAWLKKAEEILIDNDKKMEEVYTKTGIKKTVYIRPPHEKEEKVK